MASGHVNRAKRPNTWAHRPMLQTRRKLLPTRSRPHNASGEAVENLVGQHLRSIKLGSDKLGSEITNRFAVTYPDPAGGADLHLVVSIQRSGLATVTTGAWLVAVPERVLAK